MKTRSLLKVLGATAIVGGGLGYLVRTTQKEIRDAAQKEYQRGAEDAQKQNIFGPRPVSQEDTGDLVYLVTKFSFEPQKSEPLHPDLIGMIDLRGTRRGPEDQISQDILRGMILLERVEAPRYLFGTKENLEKWHDYTNRNFFEGYLPGQEITVSREEFEKTTDPYKLIENLPMPPRGRYLPPSIIIEKK